MREFQLYFLSAGTGQDFVCYFHLDFWRERKQTWRARKRRKILPAIQKTPTPNINPTIKRFTSIIFKSSPNKFSLILRNTQQAFLKLDWRGSKSREAPLEKSKQTPHCKVLAPPGPRQEHKRLRSCLSLKNVKTLFTAHISALGIPVRVLLRRSCSARCFTACAFNVKTQVWRQ